MPRRCSALGLMLVAGPTLFPSCLVTFRDWPDENERPAQVSVTAGGNAVNTQLPNTSAGGAASATVTTQGGTPVSSYSSGTTGATLVTGGTASITTSGTVWASGGSSNRGSAGSGSLPGGASGGGSGGAIGGSSPGGTSSGASTTGGTSYTTVSTTGERVQWLAFSGARANGTDPINASLGIDGEVRLDSDECAEVSFDPSTRCVHGTLCTYGFENQYWGVALVFDFVNAQGLRFRWDPRPVRAVGVTYRLHGTQIPKLQLWVLDMDSSLWPTSCSGTPCEILGPPNGDPSIGTAGSLYFDAMIRDDWDGTGIDYQHQPENTLSLQFKVPAVIAGGVPFDFCLDQLGIIVSSP